MEVQRYKAEDLIRFGRDVLVKMGFSEKQACTAVKILVEADLRGNYVDGIAGENGLDEILAKVNDKKIEIVDFSDLGKYPTMICVDANGTLGQYVASETIDRVIERMKKYGLVKADIANSGYFGDCGIYSEKIAEQNMAAKVSSTLYPRKYLHQILDGEEDTNTTSRVWSIPYEEGIITIDESAIKRAVEPVSKVAEHNMAVLNITKEKGEIFYVNVGNQRKKLSEIHLEAAKLKSQQEVLEKLGYQKSVDLLSVEAGLLKGPEGEDINYPLALDDVFQNSFKITQLGATYSNYYQSVNTFLTVLENIFLFGFFPDVRIVEELMSLELPPTLDGRFSQRIETHSMEIIMPLAEAKRKVKEVADRILQRYNLMYLPGRREQETKKDYLVNGIPMTSERINCLGEIGEKIGIPFKAKPQS